MPVWMTDLADQFLLNFVVKDRYLYLVDGLKVTLIITVMSLVFGSVLGLTVAIIKVSHSHFGRLGFLNWLCDAYTTIIRGTPITVQLLIGYFVIMRDWPVPKELVAAIAFGINSGAYVSEIIRSGILAVDRGQMEAGRSLGLSYSQTQRYIVLPQAIKNILPALGNELITLLKETSVVGYIALNDLTRGAYIIQGVTYSPAMPLFAAALIYLSIVLLLTKMLGMWERRLRRSDLR